MLVQLRRYNLLQRPEGCALRIMYIWHINKPTYINPQYSNSWQGGGVYVAIEKLKILLHSNEYSFFTISPYSHVKNFLISQPKFQHLAE